MGSQPSPSGTAATYVIAADLEQRVAFWNEGAEGTFGWSRREAEGGHVVALTAPPEEVAFSTGVMADLIAREASLRVVGTGYRRDGSTFEADVSLTPIRAAGGRISGLLINGRVLGAVDLDSDRGRVEGFRRHLVGELGLTGSTAYTYEHNCQSLEAKAGLSRWLLGVDDIRRVFRNYELSPSTKNGYLVAWRAARRYGKLEGFADYPVEADMIKAPKQNRTPGPQLTLEEVNVILDATKTDRSYRLIYLGLFAGCRVSDSAVIGIKEWERERLNFVGVKEQRWRKVPVHRELERVRDRILSHSCSRDVLKHVCKSLSHYTGIPFSSHMLRSTFSQRLLDVGVEGMVADELLGHAPKLILNSNYAYTPWERKVRAIELLNYEMPDNVRRLKPHDPEQLSFDLDNRATELDNDATNLFQRLPLSTGALALTACVSLASLV